MRDSCRGLSKSQRLQRAKDVANAAKAHWPAALFAKTKIATNVIAMQNGKPCELPNGYLLSATSLQDISIRNPCLPAKYVDALKVPSLVLPLSSASFSAAGAKVGDLVVAIAGNGAPVFGVVGDSGPANALGEASIAMNGALNNVGREPTNYRDVLRHWVVPSAAVVIFPKTRNVSVPYMTNDRIASEAKRLFAIWGGTARLRACSMRPS